MRVGIVGAGLAGLAAARTLSKGGAQTVLFECKNSVGGRVATHRTKGYVFDSGANSFTPRGLSIQAAMLEELDKSNLVPVAKPIYSHTSLHVFAGDMARAKVPRYTYTNGNDQLAKLLAQNLDVRLGCQVEGIEKGDGGGYLVEGESFDAVILTPPIPRTSALLWSIGETRPLSNSNYRPCITLMLGFARELPEQNYHAFIDPDQVHPLSWLSIENEKCPGRAPAGHTAFSIELNGPYSHLHFDDDNQELIALGLEYLGRVYGEGWDNPDVADIRRWKYSHPEGIASFETVNRAGSRLLVASDGLLGGQTEQAYEAGVRAAKMLLTNNQG